MTKEINILIDKESEDKLGIEAYHYFKETKDAIDNGQEVVYTTLSNFLTYEVDSLWIWYQGKPINYSNLMKELLENK
jgi:hypothetical protein